MQVAVCVKMPKWHLAMKDGKITRWFKQEGESIDKGQDLFEVEAEESLRKVESPAGGRLSQIFIPAGKSAPVKVVVAILAEPGE